MRWVCVMIRYYFFDETYSQYENLNISLEILMKSINLIIFMMKSSFFNIFNIPNLFFTRVMRFRDYHLKNV